MHGLYTISNYGIFLFALLGSWTAALPVNVVRNGEFGYPGLTIAKRELDIAEGHQRTRRSLLLPLLLGSAVSGRNAGNRNQLPPFAILPNDGAPNAYSPYDNNPNNLFGNPALSNPFSPGFDTNNFGNNNNPFAPVGMGTNNLIPPTNPLFAINPLLAINPSNTNPLFPTGSNPSDIMSLLSQNPNLLGGQSGAVGDVLSRLLQGLTTSLGGTLSGLLGAGNQNPNPVIPPVNPPVNPPVAPPVTPPVSPPANVPAGGKR